MPHELFSEAEIGDAFGLASKTLRHYRERCLLQPVEIETIIRGHSGDPRKTVSADADVPPHLESGVVRLAQLERRKAEIQAEIDTLRTTLDD